MAVDKMQDDKMEVMKAPSDKRQYEVLHLANGLSALLIHDPDIAYTPDSHECDDVANAVPHARNGVDHGDDSDGSGEGEDDELTDDDGEDGEETTDDGENEMDSNPEVKITGGRTELERSHSQCNHDDGECAVSECGYEIFNEDEEELDHEHNKSGATPTKKAAAALCVGVGSFSDPRDAQGLAHFLEHMLFMGSSKFPDENEYDNFLSKHGGSSNAFTDAEFTVYHFDVNSRFLKPALDRFSHFFISPLIKYEAMEREVQAVDSEFDQVRQSDVCRAQQLQAHTADASHPLHSFGWGNRRSLCEPMSKGVDMRQKLRDLYNEHYLAGCMKLCLLGGEPLETMKAWVVELFGAVPEGGSKRLSFPLEHKLWDAGKVYWVEAVKDQHYLSLTWVLPCLEKMYLKKPQDYISHLIGHEGAGSLLSLLKAKGWATSLSAGVGDGGFERNSSAYMFNVGINLTESGLNKVFDVIGLLHQYLKMLRETKPQDWVFKELQSMGMMEFKFAEEESADDYVVRLAMNMHLYPSKHIIYGDYAFEDWDPESIDDLLSYLNPKNMRIDIRTKSFDKSVKGVLFEPWFEVPYTVEHLSSELLAAWENPSEIESSLHMPEKNNFIPHDFTIHSGKRNYDIDVPVILVEDPAVKVWYKLDQTFKTPRANVYLMLTCKTAMENAKAAVFTELFIKLLRDSLNESLYLANVAKLESSTSVSGDKVELKLFGFNEKLPVLARTIAEAVSTFQPSLDRFEVIKEELDRAYRNTNLKPLSHSTYLRLQILSRRFFPVDDKLHALSNVSLKELKSFIPQLLGETHLEVLCHGNILEEEAMQIVNIFKGVLVRNPLAGPRNQDCTLKLPNGVNLVYNAKVKNNLEENSVLELYFQAMPDLGLESVRDRAIVDLFESITSEPCFNQLRTKEQLGYRVDCGIRVTYRVLGFCFRVQSSKFNPLYLQKRVDEFIATMQQLLRDMDEDEFISYKEALIAEKLEKDHSLLDETDSHWAHILDQGYLFNAKKLEAASLRDIQKKDVINWYNQYLNEASKVRRRLAIHLWGCNMNREALNDVGKGDSDACREILDMQSFKSESEFYAPLP